MGRRIVRRFALVLALTIAACAHGRHEAGSPQPILILVSFDGWRWDYIERLPAPDLKALAARGVRATAMIPSFPVLTFPNHYSIVTGLYPEHHGIVGNTMRDAAVPERFTMSSWTERMRAGGA